jgi:hypothetical protein
MSGIEVQPCKAVATIPALASATHIPHDSLMNSLLDAIKKLLITDYRLQITNVVMTNNNKLKTIPILESVMIYHPDCIELISKLFIGLLFFIAPTFMSGV